MCHSDTIALSYLMLDLEYFPQQLSFDFEAMKKDDWISSW